ncbi:Transposable element Tcb2 transposase-like 2 [Homarus americanus]|uniref:Transposable element Tcb2 transposase-like 2 n=1 Tax=Homarus americanus TaxID=6706 RepID=A0A8J5N2G7_HOMAM|nr:Transposable element Tcb2 transposase-like 2 [Homarus americanus]
MRKTSKCTDSLLRLEIMKDPNTKGTSSAFPPSCTRKLLLMDRNAPALAFARKCQHWGKEQWNYVMWSDESFFCILTAGKRTVRRPTNTSRYDPRYTINTVKHPASVMVWGAFSGKRGRAGLHFLPKNTTMNSDCYKTVLEKHLLDYYRLHQSTFFMQDVASCHRAIPLLEWPGNSPENVWHEMKRKLSTRDTNCTSATGGNQVHNLRSVHGECASGQGAATHSECRLSTAIGGVYIIKCRDPTITSFKSAPSSLSTVGLAVKSAISNLDMIIDHGASSNSTNHMVDNFLISRSFAVRYNLAQKILVTARKQESKQSLIPHTCVEVSGRKTHRDRKKNY